MPVLKLLSARRGLSALVLSVAGLMAGAPSFAANADPNEQLQPALSLEGNYLSAYVAGVARDTEAASAFYRQAIEEDPRNVELLERAFVAFLANGSMPDAFRAAERLAQRDPSNSLAQFTLAVRAMKAGRFADARAALSRGGRGRQADITAILLSAWSQAGQKNGKAALQAVDRLKNEQAFTQFREYHAALIAQLVGNNAEAEKRFKAAYDGERNTLQVVDAYARFEAKRGRKDEALAIYKTFEEAMPRHPVVRSSVDAIKAGKPLPTTVTSAQEGAAEVLYGLGVVGSGQGDELTAVIYLRLGLYLNPNHPLALVTLGDLYEKLKQYDNANEIFARVPKDAPVRPSADIAIGQNLELMGRGPEAVSYLEKLQKERPEDVEVVMALGNVQRSRKQFAEAAETYSKAIQLIGNPERSHWILFFYRGTSYERAKMWEKGEADLKKAMELVPDSLPAGKAQVLNYLAYSWVDRGENIDEAFKLLQRAVELSPRDGMIIDSLGWAYYRLGRYDDAVRELEKAVELKAGDPVINDHLGDAYWKVGRKLEAKFQWNHAKDSNPEHEDLVRILKKIDNGMDEVPAAEVTPPPAEPKRNGG
ncbi:tetratricopeptide repeat protein [Microvirga pudoricolor]|uniref:tetratricopeptide repeat protein n=1 Tax=Microvirga pudoricolor TaxID=2778729 RepID=UPI00194F032A|nr:tetratricopeptide repeat protein [Microvirga pudoricolor]MBM6595919.1 tetratricopeptide repeat protein [Microvirga pudoricolor]